MNKRPLRSLSIYSNVLIKGENFPKMNLSHAPSVIRDWLKVSGSGHKRPVPIFHNINHGTTHPIDLQIGLICAKDDRHLQEQTLGRKQLLIVSRVGFVNFSPDNNNTCGALSPNGWASTFPQNRNLPRNWFMPLLAPLGGTYSISIAYGILTRRCIPKQPTTLRGSWLHLATFDLFKTPRWTIHYLTKRPRNVALSRKSDWKLFRWSTDVSRFDAFCSRRWRAAIQISCGVGRAFRAL